MNIKLNNDENQTNDQLDPMPYSSAEERRRTGRYVAIIVGISLVCLAMYHAWVRKVPVLASVLVPSLILLLYAAWVLFIASRDKRKEMNAEMDADMDAEAAPPGVQEAPPELPPPPCPQGPTTSKGFRRCYSIA
ncbi:uncharacterized protein LOC143923232 [Arctopsyche grandis]|uniref:uncharacterized protein LOC143923232 n=1 Tax=Arctopsyche grandis TaxID=121162 RepID=UPI00406D76CC